MDVHDNSVPYASIIFEIKFDVALFTIIEGGKALVALLYLFFQSISNL
jgi:hypothetical protein